MELGSDAASSRSSASSQSNSAKVTPCSECQPSTSPGGSLDLESALEDYEEPFPPDAKKDADEWAPGEDDEDDEDARGPGDVSAGSTRRDRTAAPPPVAPMPNGHLHAHDPQGLGRNGNVVLAGRPRGSRRELQKPQPADGDPEEPPLPPMDWEALEKHLAGLQCREQEVRNLGPARTNSTSVSCSGACPGARENTHARPRPGRALAPHSSRAGWRAGGRARASSPVWSKSGCRAGSGGGGSQRAAGSGV